VIRGGHSPRWAAQSEKMMMMMMMIIIIINNWIEFKWLGPDPVAYSYESSMYQKYVKLFK
jgi:hypothetical protein